MSEETWEKVFKICGSNIISPSFLLFLRWNSFGKTLHPYLKNDRGEFTKSLKRQSDKKQSLPSKDYSYYVSQLNLNNLRGRTVCLDRCVGCVTSSHWLHGSWKPGEAGECGRGYLPITDKKQREKNRSSRQDTVPKNTPSVAHFLHLGPTSWSF